MWGFHGLLVALVGLLTLALAAPWSTPKAVADGDRLGCGTYCQSAGQYGAGGSGPLAVTIVSSGTVTADADGYVPVSLTCHMQIQCVGSLTLSLHGWSNPQDKFSWITGRSDLLVNGGATRTIGVPVPAAAIAYVRSQGGPTALGATAMVHAPPDPFSGQPSTADLMLAAPG